MIFVFDTNVLMSMIFTRKGALGILKRLWRERRYQVASSEPILAEVTRVLSYPAIEQRHQFSAAGKQVYLANLRRKLSLFPGTLPIADIVLDDVSDVIFLSVGREAQADAIVSGDPHLLKIYRYRGIPIVTPRECLVRFFPSSISAE